MPRAGATCMVQGAECRAAVRSGTLAGVASCSNPTELSAVMCSQLRPHCWLSGPCKEFEQASALISRAKSRKAGRMSDVTSRYVILIVPARENSYHCGSGGTADALASGASPSNRVGVQIPASAPAYNPLVISVGLRAASKLEFALNLANLRKTYQVVVAAAPGRGIAVTGQDLLHAQHAEFGTPIPRRIEFQRSVRAQVALRTR